MIRVCGCGRARYPETPATTAPQTAVTSSAMAPRTLSVSGGGSMCEQIIQVTIVPRAPPTADPPEAASTLLVGALDGTMPVASTISCEIISFATDMSFSLPAAFAAADRVTNPPNTTCEGDHKPPNF